MKATFENDVLLRIGRTYSNDEALQFALKKLSDAQIEIGYLKSEIAELNHKYKDYRIDNAKVEEIKKVSEARKRTIEYLKKKLINNH